MDAANYLYLSALLFTIGAVGVVVRRNAIVVFMCIELMLNAANLSFVTFSRINGDLNGQVVAFFTMVIAISLRSHYCLEGSQMWPIRLQVLPSVATSATETHEVGPSHPSEVYQ